MASSLGGYEKGQSVTKPTYLGQSGAANPLLEHAQAGAASRARAQATADLLFGGRGYTGPWSPQADPPPPPPPPGPGIGGKPPVKGRPPAGPGTPFGYFTA